MGKGKGGSCDVGRGGGGGSRGRQPSLNISITLDGPARGKVVGRGGETVKAIQKLTRTRIDTPRRDVQDGPTHVSAQDALDVLRCCKLIADKTGGGHACRCSFAGVGLAATLRQPAGQPWLFAAADSASTASFGALCLWLSKGRIPPAQAELDALLDDVTFALGGAPSSDRT